MYVVLRETPSGVYPESTHPTAVDAEFLADELNRFAESEGLRPRFTVEFVSV